MTASESGRRHQRPHETLFQACQGIKRPPLFAGGSCAKQSGNLECDVSACERGSVQLGGLRRRGKQCVVRLDINFTAAIAYARAHPNAHPNADTSANPNASSGDDELRSELRARGAIVRFRDHTGQSATPKVGA